MLFLLWVGLGGWAGSAVGGVFPGENVPLPFPVETEQAPGSAGARESASEKGKEAPDFIQVDDMLFPVRSADEIGTLAAFTGAKWPDLRVYYQFDGNVNSTNRQRFRDATEVWEDVTDLEFVESTGEGNYILVTDADENSSFVGMIGGEQKLRMDNWASEGIIVHEIGHALGMKHEHQRSDRDNYVDILFGNIEDGKEDNFEIAATDNFGDYDFESIMHYRKDAFSKNGNNTIEPLPAYSGFLDVMGQRDGLSDEDVAGMNEFYSVPPDDAYEENDSRATAYYIGSGDNRLTELEGEGVQLDDDWYRIEVGNGFERVVAECTFSHADGDVDLRLVDSTGTTLAQSRSTDDNEEIDHVVPSGGTYYLQVFYGDEGNVYDLWWDDLDRPEPEIDVFGNGFAIIDGDTGPTSTDGTDFGAVDVEGGTVVREFRVENNGGAILSLSSVGVDDGSFSAGGLSGNIGPGGFSTLTIEFDPSAPGVRTATVRIDSNDPDEGVYTFAVRGEGLAADDHGGSLNTATRVDADSSTAGEIETNGDEDLFRVDVTEGGILTATTRSSIDTVGEMFDDGGFRISSDDDSGTDRNFQVVQNLGAGTHYVRVTGFGGFTTGSYTLDLSFAPHSGSSFARPEGWMWTQGEWEWSNDGGYWYWIPPGPPFVQNTRTGQVVARPVNGWNFYAWPYFWNASEGTWYFIFQGNLPYVLNPETGQWRRWGG